MVRLTRVLVPLLLVLTMAFALPDLLTQAQVTVTPTDIPIEFIGTVESVNPGLVIVDQLPVNITAATMNVPLQPEQLVKVRGALQPDGSILAEAVEVMNVNAITPTPLPQATPSPAVVSDATVPDPLPIIVIEGSVEAVSQDSLMVNGLNFILDRSNPVLTAVQPGDLVRIEGLLGENSSNIFLIPTNIRIDRFTPVQPPENPLPIGDEGMGMGDEGMGDEGMGDEGMGDGGMGDEGMGDDD